MSLIICHSCGLRNVKAHSNFKNLNRVSSDCKAWPPGGTLGTCLSCGLTQINPTDKWKKEIKKIYAKYNIYYQGMGDEQKVFDEKTGASLPRSVWIFNKIQATLKIKKSGKALDIGCGNGAFLKALGKKLSFWDLYGTEYNRKYKKNVEKLPQVRKIFIGNLDQIKQRFNLISLIHVLEHIVNPRNFLNKVRKILCNDGILFVQIPFYKKNPFELLTVDHASHFCHDSLKDLLNQSGFKVIKITSNWVEKEISLLASPDMGFLTCRRRYCLREYRNVQSSLHWLSKTAKEISKLAKKPEKLGIFGTSVSATWLASGLRNKPDFYVDEDPARIGRKFRKMEIISPKNIPKGSNIFLGQPFYIAKRIRKRIKTTNACYYLPPS